MKQHKQQIEDITAIRTMMERASKFLSLSGLSGVIAGLIATVGGSIAYWYVELYAKPNGKLQELSFDNGDFREVIFNVTGLTFIVLFLAVSAAVVFTLRKAKGIQQLVFDTNAIRILLSILIPMIVAAIIILSLLMRNYFDLIVPTMLFLYGLGLVNAGYFTFRDIAYLGYLELILGIVSLFFPQWAIQLWITGFGILHIIYGTIMYLKYDKKKD